MSDFLDRIGQLSPKRLALLAVELHEQLESLRAREHEPIAIIGLGCRLPGGADSPSRYWDLLREGRDAIGEVPAERWDIDAYFDPDPDAPARMSSRTGGFLRDVSGFDPAFFGISPREAQGMDPQQRLLLEVVWEALEHAGVSPERLFGSPTGVFIGVCNSDHFLRSLRRGEEAIDAYLASGNAPSVVAGRVSYVLGLQGPALAIDTACSSSLVAVHLACRSLRSGESHVALAGGVNVMCSPETTIALTKAHMLAPDGRCKTFDARADGFARGEGCGVLVLKRLSDARADGDRVLAVIRGTATNQDGRSGGLTVPNGPAQEAVIRAALADAGARPEDVDYVEAHGTGTSLGDPIEVRALAGALGPGRDSARPLLIGSAKTNLGHLESAAGVAGVMKVVLALMHEHIPPHLHFTEPSPHIAWHDYPVRVEPAGVPWLRGARPRLAGVSSFGFSGTNAHVILAEAPAEAEALSRPVRPWHCVALSARSAGALNNTATRWAEAIDARPVAPIDVAHTAAVGRAHFEERLAVVAQDAESISAALRTFVSGADDPRVHRGTAAPGQSPDIVFLFTGQGAQYPGMGRALYDSSSVFRDVIDRCDALLGADAEGQRLTSVLTTDEGDRSPMHETAWTQPALFAIEYALAELWRSWGIEPAAVIGHSVGEYVAACVAGVFSLEDGLRLIQSRGRLLQALPPGGSMAAIFADPSDIAPLVAARSAQVGVAAINASDSVVISGETLAVDAILAELEQKGIRGHRLYISLAGHSPLVEPALAGMESAAQHVTMRPPRIPVAWNVTGGVPLPGTGAPNATYWRRHLREPVRFADGVTRLHADGYRVFLEVGPHPTLLALAQRTLPGDDCLTVSSLRRGHDDWLEMMSSVARLYVHGATLDWSAMNRPFSARTLDLPTYPFERRRFWIAPTAGAGTGTAARPRSAALLEGGRVAVPAPTFELTLRTDTATWLAEHRVHGIALAAAPVFIEIVQAAVTRLEVQNRGIDAFSIQEPLVLDGEGRVVQVQFGVDGAGVQTLEIHSRAPGHASEWRRHASGLLRPCLIPVTQGEPTASIRARLQPGGAATAHYDRLARMGISLGPSTRSLVEYHQGPDEILARLSLPAGHLGDRIAGAHPVLLDGALQTFGLALPIDDDSGDVYLLSAIESVDVALFLRTAGYTSEWPLPSRRARMSAGPI